MILFIKSSDLFSLNYLHVIILFDFSSESMNISIHMAFLRLLEGLEIWVKVWRSILSKYLVMVGMRQGSKKECVGNGGS